MAAHSAAEKPKETVTGAAGKGIGRDYASKQEDDGAGPADGSRVSGGEESHRRTLPVIDVRPRPPIARGIE